MMSTETNIYGVSVKFKQVEGWSKAYVYSHSAPLEINSLVIVPNNNGFYSIGVVRDCIYDYEFKTGIGYKKILSVLDFKYGQI